MKNIMIAGMLTLGTFLFSQSIKTASFYHDKYEGRTMAFGGKFRQANLTGASNTLKLGSTVKVTNQKTGKYVIVKITDRMAKGITHKIDLSKSAFSQIASLKSGLVKVTIEQIDNI